MNSRERDHTHRSEVARQVCWKAAQNVIKIVKLKSLIRADIGTKQCKYNPFIKVFPVTLQCIFTMHKLASSSSFYSMLCSMHVQNMWERISIPLPLFEPNPLCHNEINELVYSIFTLFCAVFQYTRQHINAAWLHRLQVILLVCIFRIPFSIFLCLRQQYCAFYFINITNTEQILSLFTRNLNF